MLSNNVGIMKHVEYGTCEMPKSIASCEPDFKSHACEITALKKKSHSLLDDPRIHLSTNGKATLRYDVGLATVYRRI